MVSESAKTQKQSKAKRVAPRGLDAACYTALPPLPHHVTEWGVLGVKNTHGGRLLKEVFMFLEMCFPLISSAVLVEPLHHPSLRAADARSSLCMLIIVCHPYMMVKLVYLLQSDWAVLSNHRRCCLCPAALLVSEHIMIILTGNEMVWGGADKGRATFQQPDQSGSRVTCHLSMSSLCSVPL